MHSCSKSIPVRNNLQEYLQKPKMDKLFSLSGVSFKQVNSNFWWHSQKKQFQIYFQGARRLEHIACLDRVKFQVLNRGIQNRFQSEMIYKNTFKKAQDG